MWHLSVQKKSEGSVTFLLEMVEEGWGGGNENHIQRLLTLISIFVLPFSGVNWRFPGHVIFTEGCDNERKDSLDYVADAFTQSWPEHYLSGKPPGFYPFKGQGREIHMQIQKPMRYGHSF